MVVSLLSTKLYIPPARADGVARPRLTQKLQDGLQQPGSFALLSCPAGFGKTTLLSEYASLHKGAVAWLSLDERDNDPIQFWPYLIAACQTVHSAVGEAASMLFQTPQPPPDDAVATILINDLAGLDHNLTLILDDYHTIQNEAIHSALVFLLEHLPEKLQVVVSTRIDPPWPLARFRVRNQLIELRAQDLRFTASEAATFLNRMMGLDLTAADVSALEARTEGWAAGLQLAALSMKGRSDIAGFVKAFTGSNVYISEYLVEEVLKRQPREVQEFLLQTSLLEPLNAELCEAITGCTDGQSMLLALYRANLFVVSLDDECKWFRYHHMFADLLQSRIQWSLPAEAIEALHQRAADWYGQAGLIPEAIEHSLAAKDYARVVKLVERIALPMILQAHVRTVERWLKAIPKERVEESPKINLAFAWLNLLRGSVNQISPFLVRLKTIFSGPGASDLGPSLQGEWLAVQSKWSSLQGKQEESRDLASQALQILPEEDFLVRSIVYVNLATTYEQMLYYNHAAEMFQMIVRNARAIGDSTFETLGISGQARMELMQGRLHLAFEIASEGIKRMEDSGKITPFGATLYGEIGQINYFWRRLDEAQKYLRQSISSSGHSGYSDPEIFNHVMLSRMAQMDDDWEAAALEVTKAHELAQRIPPAMIREELISQRVRVELAFGRLESAQAILQPEGFAFTDVFSFPDLAPGSAVTNPVGLLYNSALRILLLLAGLKKDQSNLKRGIELADIILSGELQCRHIPTALETLLLRSKMYAAMGDDSRRLKDIAAALELAETEGFISVFVEEGRPIYEGLRAMSQHNSLGSTRLDYIQKILAAFPTSLRSTKETGKPIMSNFKVDKKVAELDAPLVVPLTHREVEVLQLIACGDSNQTIARKLVITVSAVKKHTGNIFGKLNVNSRTQAVARARLLQLLPTDR